MARRIFFSFHFDHDSFRANQVRHANVVLGPDAAGFFDHSEYEDAEKKGNEAIRRMIRRHLEGTTVTVVLIGTYTYSRPWVQFEIEESVKRSNGLLGISIHHLAGGPPYWMASAEGPTPRVPAPATMPRYVWNAKAVPHLRQLIEDAAQRGQMLKNAQAEAQRRPFLDVPRRRDPPLLAALAQAEALRNRRPAGGFVHPGSPPARPPALPAADPEAFYRALRDALNPPATLSEALAREFFKRKR